MIKHEEIYQISEELAEEVKNARSIGASNQPVKAKYIGSSATSNNVYHYYQDVDGRYYYESERTLQFEKIIKEQQKGRKRYESNGFEQSC